MTISKTLLTLFFVFLFLKFFGQNSEVGFYGQVKNAKDSSTVEDVYVNIRINDSITVGTKTNKDGYYFLFVITKTFLKSTRLSFDHDWKSYNRKHPRDTACGHMTDFLGYLENRVEVYSDSLKNIAVKEINVFLQPVAVEFDFPTFIFAKNSCIPIINNHTDSLYKDPNRLTRHIYCIMRDNPNLVLEIDGHSSSDEKNKKKLSDNRAKYIQQKIIACGVDTKRLKLNGYSNKHLRISENELAKVKTFEEKEQLQQINRRVAFKILSWDYPE